MFNATAGFDGFVGFVMLGVERCRAHVGPEDEPDCACDIVTCEDGKKAAAINCTSYAEGLFLNLCDDPEVGESSSILSVINGQVYGECDGSEADSVTTQVARTDPEAITKSPSSSQTGSSPELDGGTTSASSKCIAVSCLLAPMLLLFLGSLLY